MRGGELDRRVVLQRKGTTLSSSGSPVETWTTVATRWSEVKPITGDERNAAQQWIAREQSQFTIRWSGEVATLSPLDRIVYPADDLGTSPLPYRSIYDIMAVHEPKRREYLLIMAARRVA